GVGWGGLVPRPGGGLAGGRAGGKQSTGGGVGDPGGAHAVEHVERLPQVLAGVEASPLAPQPLAVEEVGARQFESEAASREPVDRLAIELLGDRAVAQQRARACLEAERPFGPGGLCSLL